MVVFHRRAAAVPFEGAPHGFDNDGSSIGRPIHVSAASAGFAEARRHRP